jgi:probable F420-dependent oxidoreductase
MPAGMDGQKVTVGLMLPTATRTRPNPEGIADLLEFASLAESCGFESAWVGEHLLPSPPVYTGSFLDPLAVLSAVAARTSRILLGTCILALPLWNPVRLAKQATSLQALSGGRLVLGIGTGYNRPEFEAMRVPFSERGNIADESLDVLRQLLTAEAVTFRGRFFELESASIQPLPEKEIPILVGGGSEARGSATGASETMSERVLQRIAGSDGWLSRISCTSEQFDSDLRAIKTARTRDAEPDRFRYVYVNHVHLVPFGGQAAILEEQLRVYGKLSGGQRPEELLGRLYLFGTPEEIIDTLRARIAAGATDIVLSPATRDPDQVRLWTKHLLPGLQS